MAEDAVTGTLTGIAGRFPGALLAFDVYSHAAMRQQHKMAAKRNIAPWAWACEDPRTFERYGLRVLESAAITRPPRGLRAQLPARYRFWLPLADPVFGKSPALTLFRAATAPRTHPSRGLFSGSETGISAGESSRREDRAVGAEQPCAGERAGTRGYRAAPGAVAVVQPE